MNKKLLFCAAAICLASAGAAQAQINIQLGGPPVYEQPVYAPQPVYVEQYHHDHDPHFRNRDRDRAYWTGHHHEVRHDEHRR